MVPGASFAAIPHLNPDPADRVRATGAIAQMGNIGTTAGPPIFAVALGSAGVGGFLSLLVVASLAGAGVLWLLLRRF